MHSELDFAYPAFTADILKYRRVVEQMTLREIAAHMERDERDIQERCHDIPAKHEHGRHVKVSDVLRDYESVDDAAQLDGIYVIHCQIGKQN